MRKNVIKGILSTGLALTMSIGLCMTSFAATSEADKAKIMEAIAEVELENGIKVELPDKYKAKAEQYLTTNDISTEDVEQALSKIADVKETIRNSGVTSESELRTKVKNDVAFSDELTEAAKAVGEAVGAELNINLSGGNIVADVIVKPVDSESGSDDEDDADTSSDNVVVQPVVMPSTPTVSVDVTVKRPDGAVISVNEPVIKTTGYNFAAMAAMAAATVILVAGCVVIARKKNLFV